MTAATIDAVTPKASRLDVRRLLRMGGLTGLAMTFIAANGMLETFNNRLLIRPILSMGYLLFLAIPFVMGFLIGRRVEVEGVETAPRTAADVVMAVVAGLLAGLIAALFAAIVNVFPGLRGTFPRFSPAMVSVLTFGFGVGTGFLLLPGVAAVVGAVGVGMHWLSDRLRKAVSVAALVVVVAAVFESVVKDFFEWFATLPRFLYHPGGGLKVVSAIVLFIVAGVASFFLQGRKMPGFAGLTSQDATERRRSSLIAAVLVLALTIVVPMLLGGVLNELLTNVGLFMLMGLGLNIVVGYAGLLDLGYVAFFALGAYTYAFLASNQLVYDQQQQPIGLKFSGNDEAVVRIAGWLTVAVLVAAVVIAAGLWWWRRSHTARAQTRSGRPPLVDAPARPSAGQSTLLILLAVGASAIVAALLDGTSLYESIFSGASPFLVGLVVGVLVSGIAGILLGIPVLRLRGDYLAIVTLGFGEIIRLLFNNLRDFTGGPQGVLQIPRPLPENLGGSATFLSLLYLVLLGSAMIAFFSGRLKRSRTGRAWSAMRSDEKIAQSMGVNLVQSK